MKKLKYFGLFIIIAFSSAACFAGSPDEEEKELKAAILDPIVNHFPEEASYTKLMSKAIVQYEIDKNTQLDPTGAANLKQEFDKKPPFNDPYYKDAKCAIDDIDVGSSTAGFTARYLSIWQNKIISCGGYAKLVLIAFYFNMMNYQLCAAKPLFKEAIQISSAGGDHSFVLVEGDSGTIFAIDAFEGKITRLYNFTKLSTMSGKSGLVDLKRQEDNEQLTRIFGTADNNGKLYYDVIFVSEKTKWYLNGAVTAKIRDITKSGGSIVTLYDVLRETDGGFPRWRADYDQLLKQTSKQTCVVN